MTAFCSIRNLTVESKPIYWYFYMPPQPSSYLAYITQYSVIIGLVIVFSYILYNICFGSTSGVPFVNCSWVFFCLLCPPSSEV